MMRVAIAALAALTLLAFPALAQRTPLTQDGVVIPQHLGKFSSQGRSTDVGGINGDALGRGVAPYAVDDESGPGINLRSSTDAAHSEVTLGHDADGNGVLSLDSYGGYAAKNFWLRLNGTLYQMPLSAAIVGSDAVVGINDQLKTTPGALGKRLTRLGFYVIGDGGQAEYNWSASNCAAPDDGAQVQPTAITGCWIADFSKGLPNVRQWGAKGDCANDDGPAFLAASKLGRKILVPGGHFLISTSIASTVAMFFEGEGWEEAGLAYGEHCTLSHKGSYLVQTNSAISMFALSGAATAGSSFDNFAVLQLHPAPGSGWAPTVYPPVWALTDTHGAVNFPRIGLGAVYQAIDAGGFTWRLSLGNISGQVFSYLLRTDVGADISRAAKIHLWPFWSVDSNVLAWQAANSDVLYFRRQDGFQADDVFALPARSCLRIGEAIDGFHTGTAIHISNLFCDYAKYSVLIDSNAIEPTFSISHLWHGGGDLAGTPVAGGNAVQINGGGTTFRIDDINVLLTAESVINNTNTAVGAQGSIGTIAAAAFPTQGWNYGGGAAFGGTFPVIRDASPEDGHSVYSIAHPIFPQNAGTNAGGGFNSGVINTASKAELYLAVSDQGWSEQVLTNGGSYVWPNWASTLILHNAVSSATLTLPKSSLDGRLVTLTCDDAVTTLTVMVAGGSGFALVNPPTTCAAGQTFQFKTTLSGIPAIRTLK